MLKKLAHPGVLFVLAALGYATYMAIHLGGSYFGALKDRDRIQHIVASEELILKLNADLKKLSRSAKNLKLPDNQAIKSFSDTVQVTDIASVEPEVSEARSDLPLDLRSWKLDSPEDVSQTQLRLWQSVFSSIDFFESAKFYFIRGSFPDKSLNRFETKVGFKGKAKLDSGKWAGVEGKQILKWVRDDDDSWRITDWVQKELIALESPELMFTEVLDSAIPDARQLMRARESEHHRAVIDFYANDGQLPWRYFTPISANQRPGISVVDLNQDGYDDLYVTVRRGPNQLLINRGDGTFREAAAEWGLDFRDFNSCAVFADFDNDGDPDLILGRSIERSQYFENRGSRFVPHPSSEMPFLVVSMSAVDYNRDGLLDIYFSTYRPAVLESLVTTEQTEKEAGTLGAVASDPTDWTDEFLTPADADEYKRRLAMKKKDRTDLTNILDQIGPPNVLMVNRGEGRFELAPENAQLAVWRNSLQATWADFDEDGNPDLYIANDWAPDNLFVNTGNGFTDVTQSLGITQFGFAMGVSWGDFDRDGFQDIYVSNMYSKAGRRITSQIAELNPDYGRSVDGNFLYKGSNDGFELVSGLEPPKLTVAEAGWSWGGQFADFDNDGFLDLYVLSGYFTAPQEYASEVDL